MFTSLIEELETSERTAEESAAAERQEAEKTSCDQAAKSINKVRDACMKQMSGRMQGDATRLAIGDLLTLIKWSATLEPEEEEQERDRSGMGGSQAKHRRATSDSGGGCTCQEEYVHSGEEEDKERRVER